MVRHFKTQYSIEFHFMLLPNHTRCTKNKMIIIFIQGIVQSIVLIVVLYGAFVAMRDMDFLPSIAPCFKLVMKLTC